MDEFSYLSVLLSIIIGLAVTQILQGLRGRILSHARIKPFWPTQVWAAILLLVSAQTWWAMFSFRDRHDWNFIQFFILLLQSTILYLAAGLVYPDFPPNEEVDLQDHYLRRRQQFFGLLILSTLTSLLRDPLFDGRMTNPMNLFFHGLFIGLAVIAVWAKSVRGAKIMTVAGGIIFATYIVILYLRLH